MLSVYANATGDPTSSRRDGAGLRLERPPFFALGVIVLQHVGERLRFGVGGLSRGRNPVGRPEQGGLFWRPNCQLISCPWVRPAGKTWLMRGKFAPLHLTCANGMQYLCYKF